MFASIGGIALMHFFMLPWFAETVLRFLMIAPIVVVEGWEAVVNPIWFNAQQSAMTAFNLSRPCLIVYTAVPPLMMLGACVMFITLPHERTEKTWNANELMAWAI